MKKIWPVFFLFLTLVFPALCEVGKTQAYYTDEQTGELLRYPPADIGYLLQEDGTAYIYSLTLTDSAVKEFADTFYLPSTVDRHTVSGFSPYLLEMMDMNSFKRVVFPQTITFYQPDSEYCSHGFIVGGSVNKLAFSGPNPSCTLTPDNCILEGGRLVGLIKDDSKREFSIPEGTSVVDIALISYAYPNLTKLTLPSTLMDIECMDSMFLLSLEKYAVHPSNDVFHSNGGVLYKHTELLSYPSNKGTIHYTIPEGITAISSHAFSYNTFLYELDLPESMQRLHPTAFNICNTLRKISQPSGCMLIDEGAFIQCTNLKTFVLSPQNANYAMQDNLLIDLQQNKLLAVFGNAHFRVTLPDSIRSIGAYAFTNHDFMMEAVLNEELESIGQGAFSCTNLTSIHIPASIKTLPAQAFSSCEQLKTVTFDQSSSNLECIEDDAFSSCTALEEIELPDGLKEIGTAAFAGCDLLRKVSLPDSIHTIDLSCFSACPSLRILKLPKNLKDADTFLAFQDETLEYIIVPEEISLSSSYVSDTLANLNSSGYGRLVVHYESDAHTYCEERSIPYTLWDELPFRSGPMRVVSASNNHLTQFLNDGGLMTYQYENGVMTITLETAGGEQNSRKYSCVIDNGFVALESLGSLECTIVNAHCVELVSKEWTMLLEGEDFS